MGVTSRLDIYSLTLSLSESFLLPVTNKVPENSPKIPLGLGVREHGKECHLPFGYHSVSSAACL